MVYGLIIQSLAGLAPWVWHSGVWVKHLAPAELSIHHRLSVLIFLLAPQEDMPPLAMSYNVKMAPSGCRAWARQVIKCGWDEVSVTARNIALLGRLCCCWVALCHSGFGSVSGWLSVGHCASSLAVWRNWEGGISSSPFQERTAKLPGDIWSSEKLAGNSIA